MPPQRTITSSKEGKVRQRSSRACQPCRKRKIKCDGAEPCEACVGYGYDCVYIERQHHKPSSAPPVTPVKDASAVNETIVGPALEPKVDDPYMATESVVQETEEPFLLQSLKTRFTSAYSAVAWPKTLGTSLDMETAPRLQSYAWNPGNRAEPKVVPQNNICNIITLDEMRQYSKFYFSKVDPIFGLVDQNLYCKRSADFWLLQKRGTDMEALICVVVALGSFFSAPLAPLPAEAQVVEQGRLLLDLTVAHAPAWLSVRHVQAWLLRALYLRSTTRPHLAWLASNTAVHLAEALGLHREITESKISRDVPRLVSTSEVNVRRRVFWMTVAINQYFAAEYGRTRASIELVGCRPIASHPTDLSGQTLAILQSVPGTQNLLGRGPELLEALQSAMALPVQSPFLALLRADACFCTFRMLRSTNINLSTAQVTSFLEVIRVALDAVRFSAGMQTPWWNVVGTPFHSVCVLLSLSTSDSLAMIPAAMEALKTITTTYDSYLSREALRTAHSLVQGARTKRSKELEDLDRGLGVVGHVVNSPSRESGSSGIGFEWNNDLGMPDFLDFRSYGFESDEFLPLDGDLFASVGQNGGS